jgi:fibronectin type 3 domain-containing protein
VTADTNVPPPPSVVSGTPGAGQAQLYWSSTGGAASYHLKRTTVPEGQYTTIASPTSPGFYTDSGLANGTYFYVVSGVNSFGEGFNSSEFAVTVGPQAGTPSHLTGAASAQTVNLSWSASAQATTYTVYRGTSTGGPYTAVPGGTGITSTTYADTGLATGITYYYVVTATNSSGTSAYSNETAHKVLATPTGLSALAGDGQVTLTWASVTGAAMYQVFRSPSAGGPFSFLNYSDSSTFVDTNVLDGTSYFYEVQALAGEDASNISSVVSTTPQPAATAVALFVVGTSPIPGGTGDATILTRLTNLGYSVVVKPASGAGHVTSSDSSGKAVVAISSTVNPSDVTTNWPNIAIAAVPIVTWQGGLYYSLGMISGNQLNTDYGILGSQTQLAVSDSTDPIIRALTVLAQPVTIMTASDSFTWAKVSGASIGATSAGDVSKTLVFDYEAGAVMANNSNAPARRAGLFLSSNTANNLNSTGQALFDAAVQWASGAPSQLQSVWASVNSGQITLHWEGTSGATSFTIQQSSSPTGPFTTIATGVAGTSYTSNNLTNGTAYYFIVTGFNTSGQGAPSVVMSAVPNAALASVAITGTAYLQCRLSYDTQNHFNSHVFTALVYKGGAPVDPSMISFITPTTPPWSIAGASAIVSGTPAQTVSSCTVLSNNSPMINGVGPLGISKLTYSVKVNVGTVANPVYETPSVSDDVNVGTKKKFNLVFHFPNDSGKRTQWDQKGYPHLFDPDPDTNQLRRNDRTQLAIDFVRGKNGGSGVQVWDQASIDIYGSSAPEAPLINNDINKKIGNGEGVWDSSNQLTASNASIAALQALNQASVTNVYLVHAMPPNALGPLSAATPLNWAEDPKPFIVLTDVADPTLQRCTLAHELGHILGLEHVDDPAGNSYFSPRIQGTINNVAPVYGEGAPSFPHYLMFTDGGARIENLLLGIEATRARNVSNLIR